MAFFLQNLLFVTLVGFLANPGHLSKKLLSASSPLLPESSSLCLRFSLASFRALWQKQENWYQWSVNGNVDGWGSNSCKRAERKIYTDNEEQFQGKQIEECIVFSKPRRPPLWFNHSTNDSLRDKPALSLEEDENKVAAYHAGHCCPVTQ